VNEPPPPPPPPPPVGSTFASAFVAAITKAPPSSLRRGPAKTLEEYALPERARSSQSWRRKIAKKKHQKSRRAEMNDWSLSEILGEEVRTTVASSRA
jgi:hypothetical protein